MTSIMIGFTRAVHRLGTVYGNYSLDAQATGINAAGPNGGGSGDSTITFPASPSTNQTVTVNNTGTGTVTLTGLTITLGYIGAELSQDAQLIVRWNNSTWDVIYEYGTIVYISAPVYATFDPLTKGPSVILSNGNLSIQNATDSNDTAFSTISKTTGKWYWEITRSIADTTDGLGGKVGVQAGAIGYAYYPYNSDFPGVSTKLQTGQAEVPYGTTWVQNDVIGIALDLDSGTLTFYHNGISQGVAFTGLSGSVYAAAGAGGTYGVPPIEKLTANFGATGFVYSVPSGYNSGLYE